MRKHFLILMLFALLPLTGWAQIDLSEGWSITFEGGKNWASYSGLNVMPKVVLHHATETDIEQTENKFNVEWRNEANEVVTSFINRGRYTVTVTEKQPATFGDLATPSKMFTVLVAENSLTTPPALIGGSPLGYNVNGYQLLATPAVAKFGDVKYMVTEGASAPAADAEGWATSLAKVKKVGTHKVYYKVDADASANANYLAIAPTLIGTVVINGDEITGYTEPGVPDPTTITFDNNDHAVYTAAGVVTPDKGEFMYTIDNGANWSPAIPTVKNKGTYNVNWKIVGAEGYEDKLGGGYTFTVNTVAPVVTNATGAENLEYAAADQSLLSAPGTATLGATPVYSIKYSTADNPTWGTIAPIGEPVAYAAVKGKKAGKYQITTMVAAGGNYNEAVAADPIVVEIQKATLTVTTDAKTKVYGAPDPTFTATYTGFKGEETAETVVFTAPTLSREDHTNPAKNVVGTYAISAGDDGDAENYTFVNAAKPGVLTITPKELNTTDFTFAVSAAPLVYDGNAKTPEVTTSTYKFYDGTNAPVYVAGAMVTPNDFTFLYQNNTEAGDNTAKVIITGQNNFDGSIVIPFTIQKKPIFIKPVNNSKKYAEADPAYLTDAEDAFATAENYELGYVELGEFVKDEKATLKGNVKLARTVGENVSTYIIYVKSYTAGEGDNYKIDDTQVLNNPTDATPKNLKGAFQILPDGDGLKLKFKEGTLATKVYGEATPTYTIDDLEYVSGLVGEDKWETVKTELSAPEFALASEDVKDNATNKVTVNVLHSTNYPVVTVEPLPFIVTARPVAINVLAQTLDYGSTAEDLTQGIAQWTVNDAESYGADAKLGTDELKTALGLTLSTTDLIASYAPNSTNEKVIYASITNPNFELNGKCVWGDLTINPVVAVYFAENDPEVESKIEAVDGEVHNVQLGNKPLEAQKWYAMVLPFDTTPEELVGKLGTFLIVNRISSATIDEAKTVTVNFALEWNEVPAGVPFLIKTAKATNMNSNVFAAKEISSTIAGETKGKASFLGTYATGKSLRWGFDLDGNIDDGFEYIDSKSTDWSKATNKYRYLNVEAQAWRNIKNSAHELLPMEAYLKLDAEALGARIFVEDIDDNGTTAIKTLNADEVDGLKIAEGWYTIDGVRLQSAPAQKGIYINNGKKVVIK